MEWTNESVFEFIELYQSENLLWNPRNKFHKNRNLVADAWERIRASFSMQCTIAELKKKKESLMTTFRLHLNKKKKSIKSGAGADEVYHTNWFAYNIMEAFLKPVYEYTETRSTEPEVTTAQTPEISQPDISQPEVSQPEVSQPEARHPEIHDPQVHQPVISQPAYFNSLKHKPIIGKRKLANEPASGLETAKKQMDQAFNIIQKAAEKEQDECDLYCQFLAKRLKKMGEEQRDAIMMEIDAMIFNYKYNTSAQPNVEQTDLNYQSTGNTYQNTRETYQGTGGTVQLHYSQPSQQLYQLSIPETSHEPVERASSTMDGEPKIKIITHEIIQTAYNNTIQNPLSPDSILPE